jgi:hypothetical protein
MRDNEAQIHYSAVVTKYIELVFTGSIETKSVKPKQTADNNPAYKLYLLKKDQCLGQELRNINHIYIFTHFYL